MLEGINMQAHVALREVLNHGVDTGGPVFSVKFPPDGVLTRESRPHRPGLTIDFHGPISPGTLIYIEPFFLDQERKLYKPSTVMGRIGLPTGQWEIARIDEQLMDPPLSFENAASPTLRAAVDEAMVKLQVNGSLMDRNLESNSIFCAFCRKYDDLTKGSLYYIDPESKKSVGPSPIRSALSMDQGTICQDCAEKACKALFQSFCKNPDPDVLFPMFGLFTMVRLGIPKDKRSGIFRTLTDLNLMEDEDDLSMEQVDQVHKVLRKEYGSR